MSNSVTVEVTQTHIENGSRRDCRECPIALAITDKLGMIAEVTLGQAEVLNTLYKLPEEADSFLRQYDSGYGTCTAEPFSFVMEKVK